MTDRPIRIATRASALAVAQAEAVRDALMRAQAGCSVELLPMTTSGDKNQTADLAQWGYKGLFTKEIEEALLQGRADIAVHSMKDMPSQLPDGLMIAAMLPREDARDAWVSNHHITIDALPEGAVVGCSSVRRSALLRRLRPDVNIVPFRGNVHTRLHKLDGGEVAGTLLAVAGLNRLGLDGRISQPLEPSVMMPAVAQGAIGIECRTDDTAMRDLLAAINHATTFTCVSAERMVLAALDGSCKTPLCGLATLHGDRLTLKAALLSPDGAHMAEAGAEGTAQAWQQVGAQVAATLLKEGSHLL